MLPHPWFIANVALMVALGLMVGAPARAVAPPALTSHASVDFARPVATHSLVGFLHGLDDLQPVDRLVVPLRPTLWRGSLFSAPYARAVGARRALHARRLGSVGLSRCRLVRATGAVAGLGCVVDVRARSRRRNGDRDMVWDIWNEPDVPYFWTGTEAQYHELYRRAYVAIRQEVGRGRDHRRPQRQHVPVGLAGRSARVLPLAPIARSTRSAGTSFPVAAASRRSPTTCAARAPGCWATPPTFRSAYASSTSASTSARATRSGPARSWATSRSSSAAARARAPTPAGTTRPERTPARSTRSTASSTVPPCARGRRGGRCAGTPAVPTRACAADQPTPRSP